MLTTRPGGGQLAQWWTASRVPLHVAAGAVGQAAAAHAVLAGQGRQGDRSARTFWPPLRLRLMPSAILMRPGRRVGVQPGQVDDRRSATARSTAATRSGGKSASRSRSCGQPTVWAVQPGLVVQPLGDEDVGQAQRQGAVGAGQRGEVQVGAAGGRRAARVDDDDLAARPLGLAQERHEVRRGADRVVAPEDDELAVDHVGVGRAPALAERGLDGASRRPPRRCCARAGWPRGGSRSGRWRRSSAPGRACRCSCRAGSPRPRTRR